MAPHNSDVDAFPLRATMGLSLVCPKEDCMPDALRAATCSSFHPTPFHGMVVRDFPHFSTVCWRGFSMSQRVKGERISLLILVLLFLFVTCC